MVKIITELTLEKQKKRCAIQLYYKLHPDSKDTEIAKIFNTSPNTVAKWKKKNNYKDKIRKRKSKLNQKIKNFLKKQAINKFTGIDGASSRKLVHKIKNKFSLNVSKSTLNNWLNKNINKPKKATTTFLLKDKDKETRKKFAQMIMRNKIKGKNIFFTDEKRFILNPPLNRQTNQIRMDKIGLSSYKRGKGKLYEKVSRPMPKFSKGLMVAGGLSNEGPSKLIFVTGTMRTFSYLQTLEFFKEDIERLGNDLYFEQDNATAHTSNRCLRYIKDNFKNHLEFWPPNSPDLSPIEELWALLEEKLNKYQFSTLEEMAKKLQWLWNRIPKKICKNLISSFDKKIELIKDSGERANKREHGKNSFNGEWRNRWNNCDFIERIVYNEKILEKMKIDKLKALKKELNNIKSALREEKHRYCKKNKETIREESKELYKFFLQQEKEMKEEYQKKINEKENEIKEFKEKEGNELFALFSNEEKIKNVRLGSRKKERVLDSTIADTV